MDLKKKKRLPMDYSPPGSSLCPWDSLGKNTGVGQHGVPGLGPEGAEGDGAAHQSHLQILAE